MFPCASLEVVGWFFVWRDRDLDNDDADVLAGASSRYISVSVKDAKSYRHQLFIFLLNPAAHVR